MFKQDSHELQLFRFCCMMKRSLPSSIDGVFQLRTGVKKVAGYLGSALVHCIMQETPFVAAFDLQRRLFVMEEDLHHCLVASQNGLDYWRVAFAV